MQILFISPHFPYNSRIRAQAVYKRMGVFLEALKPLGKLNLLFLTSDQYLRPAFEASEIKKDLSEYWEIPFKLSLYSPKPNNISQSKIKQQSQGIFNFYKQSDFYTTPDKVQAIEACIDRVKPDLIFAHRLNSLAPLMHSRRDLPPIIFDLDDIEHIKFMRQIRQPPTRPQTLLYYLQVPARLWGELKGIRLATRTFICSELDRCYLADRWKLSGITTIPNAIRIPEPAPLTPEPTLMLIGGYNYFPNMNAANFLIEKVWPRVQKTRPDAKLIIAGIHPENIRAYGKGIPGIEFTGFVEDLDALYARSRVVCCPILSGGGTRVKMIEAAAYGKPIVATRIGAEGLEMRNGTEFLQRDRPQDFANACLELLSNDDLCQSLGAAARAAAVQHYDRTNIVRRIQDEILAVTSSPAAQDYAHPA